MTDNLLGPGGKTKFAHLYHIHHIRAYLARPKPKATLDPLLLSAGIEVPALTDKTLHRMRAVCNGKVAALMAKSRPRTEAQRRRSRLRGTVEEKIIREEVRDILTRYRHLGAVRVRST